MADLTVDIVTPEKVVFSGKASQLQAPGWSGQLGVLPGHVPYLVLLRAGVTAVQGASEARFVTGRGYAEIGAERVVVLVDSCEPVGAYDAEAARKDREDAERRLVMTAADTDERKHAERDLELANARGAR
ncbi:MAG TPA: ATP synthase F1 subunit epsilon [Myxococcota bacterium]|nr:ATP synthase F1 subunit epsilon [Myxococcota bacterium]